MTRGRQMMRIVAGLCAIMTVLALVTTADARPRPRTRIKVQPWHGYGFLPGVRSPERIEWERDQARRRDPFNIYYGYPGFYRGRWNGGGYGPCWTYTPIGPHYNCG